jgi:hypothetical protein
MKVTVACLDAASGAKLWEKGQSLKVPVVELGNPLKVFAAAADSLTYSIGGQTWTLRAADGSAPPPVTHTVAPKPAATPSSLWPPSSFRVQDGRLYVFTAEGRAYAMVDEIFHPFESPAAGYAVDVQPYYVSACVVRARGELRDRHVICLVPAAVRERLALCIFDQDRCPLGDAVHAALKPMPFKNKSDPRARADAHTCRPLIACNHLMGMRPVQKMPAGDRLKARGCAVAVYPAELFDEVDQLMFENPLERFQPCIALEAAHRNRPVRGIKAIEEQSASDRDLKEDLTRIRPKARGLAARFRHSRRQTKTEAPAVQSPPALAIKESHVIRLEQKRKVLRMDRSEVRGPDRSRLRKKRMLNLLDPLANRRFRQVRMNCEVRQTHRGSRSKSKLRRSMSSFPKACRSPRTNKVQEPICEIHNPFNPRRIRGVVNREKHLFDGGWEIDKYKLSLVEKCQYYLTRKVT